MNQFTQVQYLKRKTYYEAIIYYSKDGKKFRPSTEVKFEHKYLLESGNISSKYPDYENAKKIISDLQDKVEALIKSYKDQHGEKPSVEWLLSEHKKPIIPEPPQIQKEDLLKVDLLHYWSLFIVHKRSIVREEATIKKYNNLASTLEQFSIKRNTQLTFEYLDQQFFNDFLRYLITEHEYYRNPQLQKAATTTPQVGLANETAIKRLKDFQEYLHYCNKKFKIGLDIDDIKDYIGYAKHKFEVRPLSEYQKWELTFTLDELEFVINLSHYERDYWDSLSVNQKKYLDIIIFMCLQGTPPIDTKAIRRAHIRDGHINKDRSKTGNEFRVELDPISEEILERYDYNLDFVDGTLNAELKRMFVTIFELYRSKFEKSSGKKYEIICRQMTKKGDEEFYTIQHKGLFVELMTGRRSFLTILGNNASEQDLKKNMRRAGHKRIMTTAGYMHRQQVLDDNPRSLFGIKKK